jgi:hypothetical protein
MILKAHRETSEPGLVSPPLVENIEQGLLSGAGLPAVELPTLEAGAGSLLPAVGETLPPSENPFAEGESLLLSEFSGIFPAGEMAVSATGRLGSELGVKELDRAGQRGLVTGQVPQGGNSGTVPPLLMEASRGQSQQALELAHHMSGNNRLAMPVNIMPVDPQQAGQVVGTGNLASGLVSADMNNPALGAGQIELQNASRQGMPVNQPVAAGLEGLQAVAVTLGKSSETEKVAKTPELTLASLEKAVQSANAVVGPRSDPAPVLREVVPAWQSEVSVPVGKPGWGEAVMQRVMWMSSQHLQSAEIQLDPPELGPLQVRVNSQGDQTSVVFNSQHSAVRDALDQSLSRLREMMEQNGVNLTDVDVSDQGLPRQQEETAADAESEQYAESGDESGTDDQQEQAAVTEQAIGMVNVRV